MTEREQKIRKMARELREMGCAVAVITESELVGADSDRVEQSMLRAGYSEVWTQGNDQLIYSAAHY